MATSVLLAHCGTRKLKREELEALPLPEATRTHQPLAHFRIVEALIENLAFRNISLVRDEYAVSPDGMRMFGVLDLDAEFNGCRFSIGVRNSNDKSMRLALTTGYRVMVCDNMAFQGDFTPVLQKHSSRLDLLSVISIGVDKVQRNFAPLRRQIDAWRKAVISDERAKLIIYGAFVERSLPVPRSLLGAVHRHYFEPSYDEFRTRSLWSLSNAFTSAFKDLRPAAQFRAVAKFGSYFAKAAN